MDFLQIVIGQSLHEVCTAMFWSAVAPDMHGISSLAREQLVDDQ
jgi:hypothetical protein